jgi:superfamily II DNA or RNA helicase
VLVNVALCVEGFDLSAQIGRDVPIEAVSLQNPTQSLARAMQMIGRALRPKPEPAIIMDHVNILSTHGCPDDHREWSLQGFAAKTTKRTEAGVLVRVCHICAGAFKPGPQECPYCNKPIRLTPREIKQREGELAEFERIDKRREERSARTLTELVTIAKERGYKKGWVAMRLQGRGQRVSWSLLEEAWSTMTVKSSV